MKKLIIVSAVSLLTLTACEKEIDLNLENKSGQLVIEGNISDKEEPHIVRVTRSVAFTQANQYPAVSNALVIISDNLGMIDTLKYTSDGNYNTEKLKAGVSGRTYTLKVLLDGKTYTAQSELPEKVPLTGLKLIPMTFLGNTNYDVLPEYTDPPTLGNNYAFIVRANSKKGIVFEIESDNLGNGVANQRDLDIPEDDGDSVKKGDIVYVEMRSIDKNIHTYYTAVNQLTSNGPGGGISPANPPTNISGGALGYFSAHTSQILSIVVE
ncbi:MAG: DUF4249 domain-containing protein [Raineya sp.]|jgi:hypothetical protein|nr:DUF4249 domain-containing protein [Raineya sp.]